MPVPVDVQFPLFLKILTFDRNLKSRAGNEIVIAIIYQTKFKSSINTKDEFMDVMKKSTIKKIQDIPLKLVSVDIEAGSLEDAIKKENADVLYITQLRAVDIINIVKLCRTKKLISITGVPDYVKAGVSVGIDIKEQQPQILINLPGAKAEGADFSSQLLNLAKIIVK